MKNILFFNFTNVFAVYNRAMKPGRMNKYEKAYLRQQRRKKKLHRKTNTKKTIFIVIGALRSLYKIIVKKIQHSQKQLSKTMPKKQKTIKKQSDIRRVQKRTTKQKVKTSSLKNQVKKNRIQKHVSWFKKIILFFVFLGLLLAGLFFMWVATLEIPDVGDFRERKISNSTKIYDRTGDILLYDIHEDIQRTVVSFQNISQYSKDAIVAIEDHTFYEHPGVVWKSTFRAVTQTVLSKLGLSSAGSAGGSTLTQQVVKNTLLTREQTITRKVKEWVLAYKLEQQLTKDEILAVYLNEAPYGGTIYGIEEASNLFFGKTALDVSLAEAAYLAAIPNLPTYYSPYGPNRSELDQRQQIVLAEMKKYGYISDTKYREALDEEVKFLPVETNHAKALHFVQYVRAQLEETYGVDEVENGGLRVITTLDYRLQQEAEEIIKEHIEDVEELYVASNAALVAIESKTGQIITMVGSRDYFDTDEFDGNFNVALAKRQPGSSFKPIAYAAAFEKGYLPESAIFDTQTQFNSSCDADDLTSADGCYTPNNYDFKFGGPMTWRNALAQSRNIPAIKVSYLAGLGNIINYAQEMGVTSLNERPSYYGLGLVLGGGEVSLLEMVGVYGTFSNEGKHNKTNAILEVTDVDGNILEKYTKNEDRVFSRNTAAMVSSVLSDNVARTPLFGSNSFLYFGKTDVAGKTGTTNDNRDAWLVGYTSDIALGVWTGNNDNSPMQKGSSISGKPWREYMDQALKVYKARDFDDYDLPDNLYTYPNITKGEWRGGKTVYIDAVTEKLATEFTPDDTKVAITQNDPHTLLHWVDKSNPAVSDMSQDDIQYENWEYGVQRYIDLEEPELRDVLFDIPTEYDDFHDADSGKDAFDFTIENIFDVAYNMDEKIEVEIDLDGISRRDVDAIEWRVNSIFTGALESFGDFSFKPNDLALVNDVNILNVSILDDDGNIVIRDVEFSVLVDDGPEEGIVDEG